MPHLFLIQRLNIIFYLKAVVSLMLSYCLGCVEPYAPAIDEQATNILVVEGFINASDQTATVTLSRTRYIYDEGMPPHETDADVSIEVSSGARISLNEEGSGKYTCQHLPIHHEALYTLFVKTREGDEYRSDPIQILKTPVIDSMSIGISNTGKDLNILVNTHDELNATRYYSWEYTETYEYHAAFLSGYTFVNQIPQLRLLSERIDKCWQTEENSKISIASSENLSADVIRNFRLTSISRESPKISVRYSILVKQRAISLQEFMYLRQLQKSTEELGGLFDTPPVASRGNLRNVKDAEIPVLGYFSAAEIKEVRFFVEHADLPDQLRLP